MSWRRTGSGRAFLLSQSHLSVLVIAVADHPGLGETGVMLPSHFLPPIPGNPVLGLRFSLMPFYKTEAEGSI